MRFVLTAEGMISADVPEIIKRGTQAVGDAVQSTISDFILHWLQDIALWLKTNGIPIAAEGLLLWGMACFLIACSGSSGKWLERGTRAILMSVLLGVARIVGQV